MKTLIAALVTLSALTAAVAPAAAGFGPRDLPTAETSPGFGPKDLPEQPGPANSIWLDERK